MVRTDLNDITDDEFQTIIVPFDDIIYVFANNIQDGPAIEFYEDGSLKTEANFKNGEQKGKTKEYPEGKKFLKN